MIHLHTHGHLHWRIVRIWSQKLNNSYAIGKTLMLKHTHLLQLLFPFLHNCLNTSHSSLPPHSYIFLSRYQFLSSPHPLLALMLLPIFISFPCLIPSGPICLNSVHFHCWPHKDESKRIRLYGVKQNHAAALYRIKSLDIKHITASEKITVCDVHPVIVSSLVIYAFLCSVNVPLK